MPLNKTTDYAIRLILYLARNAQTVSSSKLSAAIGVSPRYLLQVGAKLRDAELISTTHGPAGGYDLKNPPREISLFDIILIMEERQNPSQDRRIYLSEQNSGSSIAPMGTWMRCCAKY